METKTCYSCKSTKPVSEFYKSNTHYYQRECKECNKHRKSAWHKTDDGKRSSANTKLKRRFGITLEDYEKMYKEQGGKCLICEATESTLGHRLAVDHCHTSGKIRGLLCKACNLGLGYYRDNETYLANAIRYLKDRA